MLIEVAKESQGYVPELSFGTHFFQDLVEANIKYLPLYPDREDNVFRNDFFFNDINYLSEIVSGFDDYKNIIKLIKVDDYRQGNSLSVFMDGEHNQAVAFLKKSSKLNNYDFKKSIYK